MSLKDTFNQLKTAIVGTKTTDIDTKLDNAIKDIVSYKTQSGRNGFIDLVRTIISKGGQLELTGFFQHAPTPAAFGQGTRLMRYRSYDAIVSNINYCFRALQVLTDNVLAPDDITKIALEIKPKTFLENEAHTDANVETVKEIIESTKLERRLDLIVKNTMEFGDFFCEIGSQKSALTSKSSFLSEGDRSWSIFESFVHLPSPNAKDEIGLFEVEARTNSENENITEKGEIKIIMDYSSLDDLRTTHTTDLSKTTGNLDLKGDDSLNKKDLKPADLFLLYYEPKRVVKLQSDMYPICFGYLIFPLSALSPHLMIQNQVVNNLCASILKSLQRKIPEIDNINVNEKDLKDTIATMIRESDPSRAMSIRYVPPDKMVHFHVPSTKYYPYGESIFDSCSFSAKVLIALETALTIHRINRSTEKRKVSVEIGMPRDARKAIEKLKEEFRKRKVSLDSFGTVDTIPCLDLGTEIRLTNGKCIPLGDLIEYHNKGFDFEVYAYDHKTGKIVPDKVVNAEITGRDVEVLKVTLDNDESVICTPEHLWMLRDGSYKMAKDLNEDESLMPLYRKTTTVHNNKWINYEMVYHPNIEFGNWELTHQSFGKYLGLYNDEDTIIHHRDKNPRNNSSNNLEGLTHIKHALIHSNDEFNGGNIGKTEMMRDFNCVICDKIFEKEYFSGTSVCSPKCFIKYKKQYSYNSWISRRGKNEYELIIRKCDICGDEFKISKSLLMKKTQNGKFISCSNKVCSKRRGYINRVISKNKNLCNDIYINTCEICNDLFVTTIKEKIHCTNVKCYNTILSRRRWNNKSKKVNGKCDNCGKEIDFIENGRIYHSCRNKDCIKSIQTINSSITKNGGKPYHEISIKNCMVCNKLTVFSPKKAGFIYGTCGSKSCSSVGMHREVYSENNIGLNHKVKTIEKLDYKIDVGDIQTENFHNFGLRAGVFIHNSMINTFEDVYIPMKDGKAFVDISTFNEGNVDVRGKVDELKFLRDQLVSSLGVPASFLNIEENLCISLESLIKLIDGRNITLQNLIEEHENGIEHEVYSYDNDLGIIFPNKVLWAGKTKLQTKLIRVHLDNEKYIDCTPEHPFMLRDGSYKEAQYLVENDSLMPIYIKDSYWSNTKGISYLDVYHPGINIWDMIHRSFYQYKHGVTSDKENVIHHINMRNQDNRTCNLVLLSSGEHGSIHSRVRLFSDEELESLIEDKIKFNYLKERGSRITYDDRNCAICGKQFFERSDINRTTCSTTCRQERKRLDGNKSWESRSKNFQTYDLYCAICGVKITSRYKNLSQKRFDQLSSQCLSCDSDFCKSQIRSFSNLTNKGTKIQSEFEYRNCEICNNPYAYSQDKIERKKIILTNICGKLKCMNTILGRRAAEQKKNQAAVECTCSICGTNFSKPRWYVESLKHDPVCGNKLCSSKNLSKIQNNRYIKSNVILNHKVTRIEILEGLHDTGDITVEKYSNFAVEAGVIVHNSNKAALTEESILFARTIVNHQKYFSHQINELVEKIFKILDPEKALTILDNVSVAFASPKSLQFERESAYISNLVNLVNSLESIGVPKEWSKKKYLTSIDWDEVEKHNTEAKIDQSLKTDETGGSLGGGEMGGMGGMGGMPGGGMGGF